MDKEKKRYVKCSVNICTNTTKNSNCSFFRYPKDVERAKEWAIACLREDLLSKAHILYNCCRVCSDHFESIMFLNDLRNRLCAHAIPTLNIINKSNKEQNDHDYVKSKTDVAVLSSLPIHVYKSTPLSPSQSTKFVLLNLPITSTSHVTNKLENVPIKRELTSIQTNIHAEPVPLQPSSGHHNQLHNFTKSSVYCTLEPPTKKQKLMCFHEVQTFKHQSLTSQANKSVQTSSALIHCNPLQLKLQRKIRRLEKKLIKIDNKNTKLKINQLQKASLDDFKNLCDKFLPYDIAVFVKEQLLLYTRKMHGQRYSTEFKEYCLNLFFKAPKMYQTLSSVFYLPSQTTLNRIINRKLITKSGINQNIFDIISIKTKNMKEADTYCIICIDEILIKPYLYYNTSKDEIIGLVDDGQCKLFNPARRACVFFAQSIFGNWKQPLLYVFSASMTKYKILNKLLIQCIINLQNINLKVVAVVCDTGFNNMQLADQLGITQENPFFVINNATIFFIYDVPYILKTLRNMFLKYKFRFLEYFTSVKYIEEFYKQDCKFNYRLAPKLTSSHINPSSLDKINVRYAAQLLSTSVTTGMNMYIYFNRLPIEATGTAIFIDRIDKLFDILNSTKKYNGEKKYAHVYKGQDFQIEFLNDCLHFFELLQVIDSTGLNITNGMKFIPAWKITISSIQKIWNFVESKGFQFLPTRKLNKDALEDFFDKIRLKEGNCLNPTSISFVRMFKHLLCKNFLNIDHENFEEDFNNILVEIKDLKKIENIKSEEEIEVFDDLTTDDTDYQKLELIEKDTIKYICRYLIKKCLTKHTCTICEDYSTNYIEFDDCSAFSFFKADNMNFSDIENFHTPDFIYYICSLEAIFIDHFEKLIVEQNFIKNLLVEFNKVTLIHPCDQFPQMYLKKLYSRMQLYYTLKFINRNFKSPMNPERLIIWRHE